MLVCPDCGSEFFVQTRTTRTEFKLQCTEGQWLECEETVVDGGDLGDHEIECDCCGLEVGDPDEDLVTLEQYNSDEEDYS